MADEQFPWLDWPHHYAPQNLTQHAPHAEENSNSQWRGPFYNSNTNLPQTQPNNATTQAPYYPSYQQQEESYVRLEDVLQYPSYRWGPPPAREYQKPASHLESTSDSPASSKPPLQSVPQAASVSQQAQALPAAQNYRPGSQCKFPSSPSQTPNPPMPRTTKPPTAQRPRQEPHRTGPQHMAPSQTRPASQSQIPSRTSSPATSQAPTLRMPQHGQQAQFKPPPRGPSSVGPQAAAQRTSRHNAQYPSPPTTLQALLPTVAPLDTQIRPLNPSPQNRPQTLSQNARQSASQSPQSAQQIRGPSSKTTSQPSSTRPTTQSPLSLPVPRPAAQSATPPVPHNVSQTLPPQGPPSTQAAPNPVLPKPPQPQRQMAQAPHTQPAHGPQGKFVAYTFQPENPADRTHLKRRMDIVSRLKESEAAQKVTYDPKTIARDILITSNRHPTEATLNYHLFRLRDVFSAVDINSDLETFRWDLVDPSEPSRDLKAKAGVPPSHPNQGSVQTKQIAPPPPVPVGSNTTQNQHGVPQPPFQQPHPPSQYQPKPQPQPQPQQKPQPQPQPQPQVQLPAPNPPVPLPVQQPKSEPSAPSTPQSMEKKRRGRPPGSTNKPKAATAAAVPQTPTSSYPVYACRWGNCQSELHNLELLKKHLFKNHASYQITCGWKGCAFTATLPAAELMKHVKKEHLESLAWKLGDGPAVPSSVDQGSSSNTVPLTIPESNQPGNEDSLIFPADYRSIRAFNRVHGHYSQHEKAGEIFKAVQRLKEHIGVGLDPGGCELATPLRNPRVADDEDVYEVRSQS
ncbi:hypothetical protein ASPVEDRAFT_247996 [Aspergillus versicolor CBS 583.65]|uniref:C2H2-type domain-containing protein n=1 Tax=Aspergillus versicolor CBS 583.65 TaxID=1036611 RepID=A0A1L9P5E2_ASPVE|nr:uncharacterized protein ASPVEDRAFT_247996 [Aspergillus versicolor CBS 583.65]OJI96643.1 hypothetical protein ASPVEDRAFT_247996 [Aspergillus versicolor CBS 583.65]